MTHDAHGLGGRDLVAPAPVRTRGPRRGHAYARADFVAGADFVASRVLTNVDIYRQIPPTGLREHLVA